jgi:hypothetical protein
VRSILKLSKLHRFSKEELIFRGIWVFEESENRDFFSPDDKKGLTRRKISLF